MTPDRIHFRQQDLDSLLHSPNKVIHSELNGSHYCLRVAIPDYADKILKQYPFITNEGLEQIYESTGIIFKQKHFGIICEFDKQIETRLHDKDMNLDDHIREVVDMFGPLILKNVYLDSESRDIGHRNRFPHLNFHRDRSSSSPTPYSLFSRDPYDPEQVKPRTSSTLFVPNITAYLQCLNEKKYDYIGGECFIQNCELFLQEDMEPLINNTVLENAWKEPHGTGEISILDNRTVLHASYYQNITMKSYRIGVRYLQ